MQEYKEKGKEDKKYKKWTEAMIMSMEKKCMSGNMLRNLHKIKSLTQIPASLAMILSLTYVQVIITEVMRKRWWRVQKKSSILFSSLYIPYCNLDCLPTIIFSLHVNALKKTDLWLQGSSTKAQHRRGTSVSSCQACREGRRAARCSIATLKVKTTNTPAGGHLQRDQLWCVSHPTRERQVVT